VAERYKKRSTVERAISKLKQFRAVATRYGKRRSIYLGTTTAAALVCLLVAADRRVGHVAFSPDGKVGVSTASTTGPPASTSTAAGVIGVAPG